ncbi:MAG: hypothetical protein PHU46_00590 [Rhodocyclaceae bacterium]|nr:hypothetical protein [Rhodocyclaceae bacterium]
MDESAYRSARGEINREPCVFEKALLSRSAVCELEVRHALAERETVECSNHEARSQCLCLLELLREKSAFALKLTDTHGLLTHAAMMRIQCGGLSGLKAVLDEDAPAPSVRRLVMLARQHPGGLEEQPWSRIVQGVAAWKIRKRYHPKVES